MGVTERKANPLKVTAWICDKKISENPKKRPFFSGEKGGFMVKYLARNSLLFD